MKHPDVEDLNFGDLTQPSLPPRRAKVRCPNCLKLYAIHSTEIEEAEPRFACVECSQHFWVPCPEIFESAEAVMGFPLELDLDVTVQINDRPFSCPKCTEPYAGGEQECRSCGIIFAKFSEKMPSKPSASAPKEVRAAWDDVIARYDDDSSHRQFLNCAQSNDALEYAFQKYENVLEANPSDSAAHRAIKELSSLTITIAEVSEPRASRRASKSYFPRLRLINLLLFLCAVVIAMGILVPGSRNLVGFGSAVLFAVMALRFYFRVL